MAPEFKILVLFVHISKVIGLLRNCVSEDEWNSDTSGAPRCQIVLPEPNVRVRCYGMGDETEITVNRMPPDQQKENNTPVIVCNASYPVDVDQVGFKFKSQPNIFFFRYLDPISTEENPQKIHSIVIPLYSNIWSPRWFIFRSTTNPELHTKFYFYYPGGNDRSLPYDWPNSKVFPTVVVPEERYAVLPCQVTHRSDVVVLRKNKCSTGEDLLVEVDNRTVMFVPRDGFIVDTWAEVEDSVYGVYTCIAQNRRKPKSDLETLQVTLRRPKEFSVKPNTMKLYFFTGDTVELNCKSSKRVQMSGSFNGRRIQQQNFTYFSNSTLRSSFAAKFIYENLLIGDSGEVTCKNDGTKSHTWSFQTLDLRNNRHLEFFVNDTHVRCSSKMSSYISIFNAECFNEAHCRSRTEAIETFGAGQCDLKLSKIVQCADNCVRNRAVHDKCFDVAKSRRSGIYKCETEDLAKRVEYLMGYDDKIYPGVRDLQDIPIDALIRISNPTGIVYSNENHTFYCQASSFISNGEFHWLLKAPNGTEFKPSIIDVQAYHYFMTGNDSVWSATIVFTEPIVGLEVVCLVPIWNTADDWLSNSVRIDVILPTVPKIDEKESLEQMYYIGDSNKFIPCNATGKPRPTVQWYRNRQPVNPDVTDKGGTDLIFREINDDISGTYTCVATSPGGTTTRDFWVTVQTRPNPTLYVVVGVFFVAASVVCLMILYWKLVKAKRRIRNLTDEEVHEFLHGNEEAAKAAKEPHEVIIHLPFNPEFEIARERLDFDEHDVLGSGAYGVVLKGKLQGFAEEVAIKTLKPHSTLSYFKALLSELKIMVYLGKHENVVQLIGAYTGKIKERVLYMVVELSPYGNLEAFLRNQSKNFQNQIRGDVITIPKATFANRFYTNFTPEAIDNPLYINVLCTSDLVSMSHQIAQGMLHLATKKVIHADLACRNVLLYNDGVVKITDFGLSRQLYAYTSYMKKEQEPLPWRSMAIESLREMNFSSQSDVWAYGVTLWEIFSLGAVPYPGLSWSIDFVDKLTHGLRLSKPTYATSEIYEIMLQCWHTIPSNRPTFDELRDAFGTMWRSVQKLGNLHESSRENIVS